MILHFARIKTPITPKNHQKLMKNASFRMNSFFENGFVSDFLTQTLSKNNSMKSILAFFATIWQVAILTPPTGLKKIDDLTLL